MKSALTMRSCAFCGQPAIDSEHCPPKILFINKDRPPGWEFAACKACNQGKASSEQVFAFFIFANIYNLTPLQQAHINKIALGLWNNNPSVMHEMRLNHSIVGVSGLLSPQLSRLDVIAMGPHMQSHVDRIVDKLAFAAFWTRFMKEPKKLMIRDRWITNMGVAHGALQRLKANPAPIQTLSQGKKTSKGQFEFQIADDGKSALWARFVFHRAVVLDVFAVDFKDCDPRFEQVSVGFRSPDTSLRPPSPISITGTNFILRPPQAFGSRR